MAVLGFWLFRPPLPALRYCSSANIFWAHLSCNRRESTSGSESDESSSSCLNDMGFGEWVGEAGLTRGALGVSGATTGSSSRGGSESTTGADISGD